MLRKLLLIYRRQMLLRKLRELHSWGEELLYSTKKVREAQARNEQEIGFVKARLAKLDGESMIGEARVVVR